MDLAPLSMPAPNDPRLSGNHSSRNDDKGTGKAALKPELLALINSWRASAVGEKERVDLTVGDPSPDQQKRKAETLERCAEDLERLLEAHERTDRSLSVEQLHFHPIAKTRKGIRHAGTRKDRRRDRIIDAILLILFFALIAGCAHVIIKMMTTWKIKGLG